MRSQDRELRELCGLLARPRVAPEARASLRALIRQGAWNRIQSMGPVHELLPLFRHHLAQLDLEEGSAGFVDLARDWARRAAMQRELLVLLHKAGVQRMLLVKGAALAPLYPSPALRRMCDLDLVLLPEDLEGARRALREAAWLTHHHEAALVWQHPGSRFLADVHIAKSRGARQIVERATPHPRVPHALIPDTADHYLILALHAANNGGNRVWRDVCDAHVLLEQEGRRDLARRSAATARHPRERVALAAFTAFINRWSPPREKLLAIRLRDEEKRHARARLELYEAMAASNITPAEIGLAKQVFRPVRQHAAAITSLLGGSRSESPWAEQDPALGLLPQVGSWQRQWVKIRFLAEAVAQRRLGMVRSLAHRHEESAKGSKLFSVPQT